MKKLIILALLSIMAMPVLTSAANDDTINPPQRPIIDLLPEVIELPDRPAVTPARGGGGVYIPDTVQHFKIYNGNLEFLATKSGIATVEFSFENGFTSVWTGGQSNWTFYTIPVPQQGKFKVKVCVKGTWNICNTWQN